MYVYKCICILKYVIHLCMHLTVFTRKTCVFSTHAHVNDMNGKLGHIITSINVPRPIPVDKRRCIECTEYQAIADQR